VLREKDCSEAPTATLYIDMVKLQVDSLI
jgi:hypothetical protein